MENKKQGYKVRKYQGPVKRYCQMLNLKNDAALIAEYRKRHSEGKVWPETLAAIREVGILEMEIYILGTNLFMIVETPLDFDWDTAMARMATLPRQAEWEEYMSVFQQAEPGASSAEKWQLMDRMFYFDDLRAHLQDNYETAWDGTFAMHCTFMDPENNLILGSRKGYNYLFDKNRLSNISEGIYNYGKWLKDWN